MINYVLYTRTNERLGTVHVYSDKDGIVYVGTFDACNKKAQELIDKKIARETQVVKAMKILHAED